MIQHILLFDDNNTVGSAIQKVKEQQTFIDYFLKHAIINVPISNQDKYRLKNSAVDLFQSPKNGWDINISDNSLGKLEDIALMSTDERVCLKNTENLGEMIKMETGGLLSTNSYVLGGEIHYSDDFSHFNGLIDQYRESWNFFNKVTENVVIVSCRLKEKREEIFRYIGIAEEFSFEGCPGDLTNKDTVGVHINYGKKIIRTITSTNSK